MSNKAKVVTEEVEILDNTEQNRDLYTVKVNIKRNGIVYSPGEKIMIEEESAMILLADGAIE